VNLYTNFTVAHTNRHCMFWSPPRRERRGTRPLDFRRAWRLRF